jgi:hypothetical protein
MDGNDPDVDTLSDTLTDSDTLSPEDAVSSEGDEGDDRRGRKNKVHVGYSIQHIKGVRRREVDCGWSSASYRNTHTWPVTGLLYAAPGVRDASVACSNYRRMVGCYDARARPPSWVLEECDRTLLRFGSSVIMLHTGSSEEALKLATQREPVNIGMDRSLSDMRCLKRSFGYSVGYYAAASQGGDVFPPQIGILCTTPVRHRGRETIAHVINVVGIAFDSALQPDARYFGNRSGDLCVANGKSEEFLHKMEILYGFAFRSAAALSKTLVLAAIGASAFRPRNNKWSEAGFVRNVIEVVVERLTRKFPGVKTIKTWDSDIPPLMIPDGLFDPPQVYAPISGMLFMNAWDPFSMCGNGNKMDNSLDGYWGRSSAISLLAWPSSNPHFRTVFFSLETSHATKD